ncbi:MAG: myo-inosose-2 dehydratase [Firmicutes bacterium]|nr:myo-inosose-2 dehydratase [Bacillota bacterium]
MLNKKLIKLGIAPIGWTNDDMPDLGGEITFEQCVSEMALAGFSATEIGNKYPQKPKVLKAMLKIRKLHVANSWFSSFILTEDMKKVEKAFRAKCAFLKALGAKRVGVSEQSHSIQGNLKKSVFNDKYVLNDSEWKKLGEGLNRLGQIAQEYNILLTFHHHMGTVVQTASEIDRLMEITDKNLVFLLFDSGHLAYAGEDYIVVLKKYIARTRHIHLKDVRQSVIAEVKKNKLSFLDGVRMGTFTVPGDGDIDFAPLFKIIADANYAGCLLVEAEQDPAKANPFEYALKARKYIKKTAGI